VERAADPPSARRATDSIASTTFVTGIVVTISAVEEARKSGSTALPDIPVMRTRVIPEQATLAATAALMRSESS
jgi:hypothetical protein